jgi:outer membrane receptor protein involved in Fe transport
VKRDLNARLNEHLRVNVGGNYTSAKITQPVLSDAMGIFNSNARWVGPSQGTFFHGDPAFNRPAYFVMGGSAGIKWSRFDVTLFLTNLLNQTNVLQRPNIALVEYGMTVRPRTVGLGATYSF